MHRHLQLVWQQLLCGSRGMADYKLLIPIVCLCHLCQLRHEKESEEKSLIWQCLGSAVGAVPTWAVRTQQCALSAQVMPPLLLSEISVKSLPPVCFGWRSLNWHCGVSCLYLWALTLLLVWCARNTLQETSAKGAMKSARATHKDPMHTLYATVCYIYIIVFVFHMFHFKFALQPCSGITGKHQWIYFQACCLHSWQWIAWFLSQQSSSTGALTRRWPNFSFNTFHHFWKSKTWGEYDSKASAPMW